MDEGNKKEGGEMSVWDFRMWIEEKIPMWVTLLPIAILLATLLVKKWLIYQKGRTTNE